MRNYAARRYQAMDVGAMSGPRLLVLVYSQIVASLKRAQAAVQSRDHAARADAICRARDLIHELAATLDRDAGGELADNLLGLYEFFVRELTQIDFRPDAARLARIVEMITTLHQAWAEAARQSEGDSLPVAINQ
ncbi:MAG TPA: flagellar export chaperone FliS [Gemmatimonadales bacterium]|nr:flagellar export chaperone FliS [Gemmatimonadales bacterium]